MKLASVRQPSQGDRIVALEEARKTDDSRLVKIERTVDEIHTLLVSARGVKAFIDGAFKYVGYAAAIGAAGVAISRFYSGH